MKRRTSLAILVAIGLMGQSMSADILSQSSRSNIERAVVVIDGHKRAVGRGDVVAQGRRIDAKVDSRVQSEQQGDEGSIIECDFPETKYGLEGTGVGSAAIRIEITDDCQMVVASIDEDVPLPERLNARASGELDFGFDGGGSAVQAADVRRQTGGWNNHFDVIGLLLTEAYAHIKYHDDGRRVSDAYGQRTWCYTARDGWHGTGSLWNWSQTRRTVWIWKRCSMSFVNGSFKHDLDVDVYSWPGNDWAVYCTERGNFVPGGSLECGKRHRRL